MSIRVRSFPDLGLSRDSSDADIWRVCQKLGLVLVTGNRNREGPDSLAAVVEREGGPVALPVLTMADPDRIVRDKTYAHRTADRLIEILLEMDR